MVGGRQYVFNQLLQWNTVSLDQSLKFNPNSNSFSLVTWAKPIKANDTDGGCGCDMKTVPFIDTYTYYVIVV